MGTVYPIVKKYILKLKLSGKNNEYATEEIKIFDNLNEANEYIKTITNGFEFTIEPYYF